MTAPATPVRKILRRNDSRRRAEGLRLQYGMTIATYDALLAGQNGVCAICKETCSTGNRLAVDHDHSTGRIRGLLCRRCNLFLGVLEDVDAGWPEVARHYLLRAQIAPKSFAIGRAWKADTGRKRNNSTVWSIDPSVDEPERHA